MADPHVVYSLKAKRAAISGEIIALRKQLRAIDAVLRLWDVDGSTIAPKRVYRRSRLFSKGELSRRLLDTLRTAGRPATAAQLAAEAVKDKPSASDPRYVAEAERRFRLLLVMLMRRRVVTRTGNGPDALWALADD